MRMGKRNEREEDEEKEDWPGTPREKGRRGEVRREYFNENLLLKIL
jgi:hypothetical protein